ncbi:LuxR family transcriptional regulator [Thioclava sp. 15-R06ZXC-3]|uniref:LuxR family transcriptional regulator n=1 Tax=Thioclava arctica TaxID=3238301 RepID=A0ABV3TH80_9RHOB
MNKEVTERFTPVSYCHAVSETNLRPAALNPQSEDRRKPFSQRVTPLTDRAPDFDVYVVIDNRALERACFVQCLQQRCEGSTIVDYETLADWRDDIGSTDARQVILSNLGSRSLADEKVRADLQKLIAEAGEVPVVVLGACEDIEASISALECGAAGYISPCVRFVDIVEATRLAVGGGIFLPRAALMALRKTAPEPVEGRVTVLDHFTDRQLAVADALRCGAANKMIAYQLQLRESTVKVHIRNIFQKLKATNRTEAAFLLNQMNGWPEAADGAPR